MSTTKTLLLIRHAEAGWDDLGQEDITRTLTKRGIQQAHHTANHIHSEGLLPDAIFSSTAQRTLQTSQILASDIAYPIENIVWHDALYLAETCVLLDITRQSDDSIHTLAIVAHNPGLSEFAMQLLNEPVPDMSPATVMAISWQVQHWQEISIGTGTLRAYLPPKA